MEKIEERLTRIEEAANLASPIVQELKSGRVGDVVAEVCPRIGDAIEFLKARKVLGPPYYYIRTFLRAAAILAQLHFKAYGRDVEWIERHLRELENL
ncbi:MAG TPA: hypothetical protein ENF83_04525 [Candidatus Korarchaeota archaeon]|nr:hypothetical protein [Candidatus Korarchaeota archaeon]